MAKKKAHPLPDSLHPAVVKALNEYDFLYSLAEHFPDIYRIIDEYARIASVCKSNDEICRRLVDLAKATESEQLLNGCVPSDTSIFSQFAATVTKDACLLISQNGQEEESPCQTEKILPKSARRVLVRQKAFGHA